jgi:hypothetical protein
MDLRTRVGDTERERTVAELQRYLDDGQLTTEEFAQRSSVAYGAKTRKDLLAVTEDLAPQAGTDRPPDAPGRPTKRTPWRPLIIVLIVLVGLLALGVAFMLTMMIVMMAGGGMGDMGGMG